MKKVISAVLSAALCLSAAALPIATAADVSFPESATLKTKDYGDDKCGVDAHWKLEGGTLTISGSGNMTDWEKANLSPWYEKMSSINSVVIEEGITSVGRACFLDGKSITSVKLPSTITSINMSAFQGSSISSIDIPASCTTIGDKAFYNCGSLSEVIIRNGNCKIVTPGSFSGVGGTIVSPAGGTVETFAKNNNHSFKALDGNFVPETTQPVQTTTVTTTTLSSSSATVTTTAVPLKIESSADKNNAKEPGEAEWKIATITIRNVGVKFGEFEFDIKSDSLEILEKTAVNNGNSVNLKFKTNIPATDQVKDYPYTVTVTKATDLNGNDLMGSLPWTKFESKVSSIPAAETVATVTTTSTTTTTTTTTVTTTSATETTSQTTQPTGEAEVIFDFGNYSAQPGQKVKVNVLADSKGVGIAAMDVKFKLDKGLTLIDIAEESPAFSKAVMVNLDILGANFTAIENGTGAPVVPEKDEPVFVLAVKVDDNAANGTYKVGFDEKVDVFRDATKNNFKIDAINGNIEVTGASEVPAGDTKLGDVNVDGIIDARDATLILTEYAKSSAEGGSEPFSKNEKAAAVADVNGDNVIDARDATLVCTYYAYISVDGNPAVDLKTWLENK